MSKPMHMDAVSSAPSHSQSMYHCGTSAAAMCPPPWTMAASRQMPGQQLANPSPQDTPPHHLGAAALICADPPPQPALAAPPQSAGGPARARARPSLLERVRQLLQLAVVVHAHQDVRPANKLAAHKHLQRRTCVSAGASLLRQGLGPGPGLRRPAAAAAAPPPTWGMVGQLVKALMPSRTAGSASTFLLP